jgi:hypothetical protein
MRAHKAKGGGAIQRRQIAPRPRNARGGHKKSGGLSARRPFASLRTAQPATIASFGHSPAQAPQSMHLPASIV